MVRKGYNMEYCFMSIEDAKKMAKKDAIVMVARRDLEDPEQFDIPFERKYFRECEKMISEAKTIMKSCDDIIKKLELFTAIQNEKHLKREGWQNTILFKD